MCRISTQTLHTRARNTADFSLKLPARTKRRRAVAAGFAHVGPSRAHRGHACRRRRPGHPAVFRSSFPSHSCLSTHSSRAGTRALFSSTLPLPQTTKKIFSPLLSSLSHLLPSISAESRAGRAQIRVRRVFRRFIISACSAPPEILSSRSSRRASRARRACSSSPTRCRTTRRA